MADVIQVTIKPTHTRQGAQKRPGRGYVWYAGHIVTKATRADCQEACRLIDGLLPEYLLPKRGYDTDEIIVKALSMKSCPVIPLRKNRREQCSYDKDLYKLRHLVENAFLHLKPWRGITTRYAKKASSFLAILPIKGIALWTKII